MPQPDEQQPTGLPEPGSPSDWLRYARSDLALAELVPPSNVLLETLCFHAQQVAEKALKAMLLHFTSQEPPFIHDIGHLLDDVRPHIMIPSRVEHGLRSTLSLHVIQRTWVKWMNRSGEKPCVLPAL